MLYHLFNYLNHITRLPGLGALDYISTRALLSLIVSLIISMLFGKKIINYIKKKSIGETVRDLGLSGQNEKSGTPTIGGIIILISILIPTLLFANLCNVYIIIMIISTIWLGTIGFIDDYIKVFKKNKEGLKGKFKVIGQVGIGIIVATILYFHPQVVIRERIASNLETTYAVEQGIKTEHKFKIPVYAKHTVKSTKTTIPFVKHNELDYTSFIDENWQYGTFFGWLVFTLIIVIILVSVSNGANLTDGIDGLAAGTSAIIGVTLGVLAYVSGNTIFADYLNIMYLPNTGELVIFIAAFVGACVGFLWYNSYPAQIFMGDTGSLAIGGIIAVFAITIRKELLIPILCGIFLVENLSVVLQVYYFKFQKRKKGLEFAKANRLFLMAPLHHHFQKKGLHESKIVNRFFIVGIILAALTIITLKIR